MTDSKSNSNQCNEITCIPVDNYCDNQGSKVVVPVTLHNVCECDHLLVIVEIYKGNCLYSRQIKEIFVVDTKKNNNSYCNTSSKQINTTNFCSNTNQIQCNSYLTCASNNNYHSGLQCNSQKNNCSSNQPNNYLSKCNNNVSNECFITNSKKLIQDFYVGEFEFFFLCEIPNDCIQVQVKTQLIYNF